MVGCDQIAMGLVEIVDPSDKTLLIRSLEDGHTSWISVGADMKLFKQKPVQWHVARNQPEELTVGMFVHRGPDWSYEDQDIYEMPKAPDPTKVIVPGEVIGPREDGDWYAIKWPNNEDNYKYNAENKDVEVIEKY
jgi:hypothetical protein